MTADLHCPACDRSFAATPTEPWRCSCGSPLELAARPVPEGPPRGLDEMDTTAGLWTFSECIPITRRVTLGEGLTPLLAAPEWDAEFKLEYVFPTGSFKDRGATTTLSRALELGVEKVLEDSSGNAGAAIATYAARAGIDADIYVPADVKQSKLMAIQRVGARPVRVQGSRADVTAACIEAVEAGEGWYASHAWNPAFYAGTMTFAIEVAAQRDWTVPDAVVMPIGHGTLFLGAHRGFELLYEAGFVDRRPRLLGAQARGYHPIVRAVDGPVTGPEDATENELADGIRIGEPARSESIVAAIEETDGDAVALHDDPVEVALDDLHRAGFYVEPTCAIAPAALREFRERGTIAPGDEVVVPLTGSGLKTL